MRMTCTLVVRASNRPKLEGRTKRLGRRVKDLSAEVRLLRWEQRAGRLAAVHLRAYSPGAAGPAGRDGTVVRTYPFSAGTLAIEGACRLASLQSSGTFATSAHGTNTGVAALTGISGAGKDDSLRVLLSREPTHVRGDRRQLRNGHVGQLLAIQRRVGSSVWMSGRDRGSL
jgi:hypothetical protein